MSTIKIGMDEKPLKDADSHWITQEINGRRHDGETVCVVVTIEEADVKLCLATPTCGGGIGRSRQFNARETELIELWKRHDLNEANFTAGNVVAFVKQALQRI